MKSVISAGVIFILIVIMVLASTLYVNSVADEMLQILYNIENNFSFLSSHKLKSETDILEKLWNKNRTALSVVFNHQEIKDIDICIKNLANAVNTQNEEEFAYEKTILKQLVYGLVEQQKISIGNIM